MNTACGYGRISVTGISPMHSADQKVHQPHPFVPPHVAGRKGAARRIQAQNFRWNGPVPVQFPQGPFVLPVFKRFPAAKAPAYVHKKP